MMKRFLYNINFMKYSLLSVFVLSTLFVGYKEVYSACGNDLAEVRKNSQKFIDEGIEIPDCNPDSVTPAQNQQIMNFMKAHQNNVTFFNFKYSAERSHFVAVSKEGGAIGGVVERRMYLDAENFLNDKIAQREAHPRIVDRELSWLYDTFMEKTGKITFGSREYSKKQMPKGEVYELMRSIFLRTAKEPTDTMLIESMDLQVGEGLDMASFRGKNSGTVKIEGVGNFFAEIFDISGNPKALEVPRAKPDVVQPVRNVTSERSSVETPQSESQITQKPPVEETTKPTFLQSLSSLLNGVKSVDSAPKEVKGKLVENTPNNNTGTRGSRTPQSTVVPPTSKSTTVNKSSEGGTLVDSPLTPERGVDLVNTPAEETAKPSLFQRVSSLFKRGKTEQATSKEIQNTPAEETAKPSLFQRVYSLFKREKNTSIEEVNKVKGAKEVNETQGTEVVEAKKIPTLRKFNYDDVRTVFSNGSDSVAIDKSGNLFRIGGERRLYRIVPEKDGMDSRFMRTEYHFTDGSIDRTSDAVANELYKYMIKNPEMEIVDIIHSYGSNSFYETAVLMKNGKYIVFPSKNYLQNSSWTSAKIKTSFSSSGDKLKGKITSIKSTEDGFVVNHTDGQTYIGKPTKEKLPLWQSSSEGCTLKDGAALGRDGKPITKELASGVTDVVRTQQQYNDGVDAYGVLKEDGSFYTIRWEVTKQSGASTKIVTERILTGNQKDPIVNVYSDSQGFLLVKKSGAYEYKPLPGHEGYRDFFKERTDMVKDPDSKYFYETQQNINVWFKKLRE